MEVDFPQMFLNNQTKLIFQNSPIGGLSPFSTFAASARAQRVFGITFRASFGDTGEIWFPLSFTSFLT